MPTSSYGTQSTFEPLLSIRRRRPQLYEELHTIANDDALLDPNPITEVAVTKPTQP